MRPAWVLPTLPDVRRRKTHVVVRLAEHYPAKNRLTLRHDGWGDGTERDEAFDYFLRDWQKGVLARLRSSFEVGPVDLTDLYSESG
ncbi:MAG TPA: hypothetical protein VJK02_11605 [Anaerolineales bacterium]|nr:hypothetical protein [Anaerolineales bacterium]